MKHSCLHIFVSLLTAIALLLSGCADGEVKHAQAEFADTGNANDTWLVYWYLCGTDLESRIGAASMDLQELSRVKLPPNVKVIIQTGGTNQWQSSGIPNNAIARWLYDENGFQQLESLPDADMASSATLSDFVRFGSNIPADHRVFVFWDHGGGSTAGVILDERTQHTLSLDDIRTAFTSVHGSDTAAPAFDVIGFDACLMATIDMTRELHGLSRYMVASEELEPGCGWDYTGWLSALAKNPAISPAGLGKAICDTYLSGCREIGQADQATLSVTDLSKTPQLTEAYHALAVEALQAASRNPQAFFRGFDRGARSAENYGGNTREQGYANMVDLADLAKNSRDILPGSVNKVVNALNQAVVYRVNGQYRPNASGLSCYYSYNNDPQSWQKFASLQAPLEPFKCLYYYILFGQLPSEAGPYLAGSASTELPQTPAEAPMQSAQTAPSVAVHQFFNLQSLENHPVYVDEKDGAAYLTLTPAQMENLTAVHCQFFYFDKKDDILIYLGSDTNIQADWDKGLFRDNFNGTWPALDGHPIYMEITQEEDDYNLYAVPIKLNGEECNLVVAYNYKDEKYHVLGARKGLDTNGLAAKNLIKLKKGDRVTTLHYAMTISGTETDYTQVEVDTFTLGDTVAFQDEAVGEGKYGYYFEFVAPDNQSVWSEMVTYAINKRGEITTSVQGDMFGNPGAEDTPLPNAGDGSGLTPAPQGTL